jgi:hypothetical protein
MPAQVPIDRSSWSRSSQRSSGGHFDSAATYYEGIAYRCLACSASCVFTPDEQKVAYEVTKKFVWWLPSLCAPCQRELSSLQGRDRALQAQWNAARDRLAQDQAFLRAWLSVLQSLRVHGKANESMERMLTRRLHEYTSPPEARHVA